MKVLNQQRFDRFSKPFATLTIVFGLIIMKTMAYENNIIELDRKLKLFILLI